MSISKDTDSKTLITHRKIVDVKVAGQYEILPMQSKGFIAVGEPSLSVKKYKDSSDEDHFFPVVHQLMYLYEQ